MDEVIDLFKCKIAFFANANDVLAQFKESNINSDPKAMGSQKDKQVFGKDIRVRNPMLMGDKTNWFSSTLDQFSSFGKDQTPDYASVTRKLYFDKYQEKYGDGNDKTDLKYPIKGINALGKSDKLEDNITYNGVGIKHGGTVQAALYGIGSQVDGVSQFASVRRRRYLEKCNPGLKIADPFPTSISNAKESKQVADDVPTSRFNTEDLIKLMKSSPANFNELLDLFFWCNGEKSNCPFAWIIGHNFDNSMKTAQSNNLEVKKPILKGNSGELLQHSMKTAPNNNLEVNKPILKGNLGEPAQNQIQAVFGNQIQPVLENQFHPVRGNQIPPAMGNQIQPAMENQFQPVLGNQIQPAIGNQIQPAMGNQVQPAMGNQIQPAMGNQIQPAMGNQIQPAMGNQIQPVLDQFQPAMGNQIQPAMGNQFQPAMGNQLHPSMGNQIQHVLGDQFQPAMGNQIQPAMENQFQPAMGNQFQPVLGDQFQPAMEKQFQPAVGNQFQPAMGNQFQSVMENLIQPVLDQLHCAIVNQIQPLLDQFQQAMEYQFQHAMEYQFQHAMGNQVQPAMGHQFHPAMGNQFQPAMGNQFQPAMGNQFQPALGNQIQPAMRNQVQPVLENQFQPALGNQFQSALGNQFQPVLGNQFRPVLGNQIQPVLENQFQPVLGNYIQPVLEKTSYLGKVEGDNAVSPIASAVHKLYIAKCQEKFGNGNYGSASFATIPYAKGDGTLSQFGVQVGNNGDGRKDQTPAYPGKVGKLQQTIDGYICDNLITLSITGKPQPVGDGTYKVSAVAFDAGKANFYGKLQQATADGSKEKFATVALDADKSASIAGSVGKASGKSQKSGIGRKNKSSSTAIRAGKSKFYGNLQVTGGGTIGNLSVSGQD